MTTARASAPAVPRADADATRARHMRAIAGGRATAYAIALGVVGAVVFGAWLREPLLMLAGPAVVLAAVLGICFLVADRRAEDEFFLSFARARGFAYAPRTELLPLTPLLGAGERRECRHWMEGPLGDSLPACGLGHYVFRERQGSGRNRRWKSHDFTVCVVDLGEGIAIYPGVFLARRRDLVDRIGGGAWLHTANRRRVELESEALHERCDLWVERSQDDVQLLQLFSPSFVSWLAEHPMRPCFEYRAGTLVVYLEQRVADAGRLSWLLDATAEIARRLRREVREAAGMPAA
jgi:hypothetical protein